MRTNHSAFGIGGRTLFVGIVVCVTAYASRPVKQPEPQQASTQAELDQAAGRAPGIGETVSQAGTSEVTHSKQVVVSEKTKVPSVTTSSTRADLNRVQPDQLAALGVPKAVADNIVKHRSEHGQFKSLEELRSVEGMNDGVFNLLKGKVGIATG